MTGFRLNAIALTGSLVLSLVGCGDDPMMMEEPPAPVATVPDHPACDTVRDWNGGWVAAEERVLELVNEHRATGYNCDTEGNFGPAPALTMQLHLRCAARIHSQDMVDRGFFDHTNPDGEGPGGRIDRTEYPTRGYGENIYFGSPRAADAVQAWMESDGHCRNIMDPDFDIIGVGRDETHWTQVFGIRR